MMLAIPLVLNRCRAADDLRKLLRDRGLAGLVVDELQLVDQLPALSEALFIATMRAAISQATFSTAPWYTCDSM